MPEGDTVTRSKDLLSPAFLRELEALRRWLLLRTTSDSLGDAPGRRHGGSADFSDHRRYVPGDDPQRIDWTIYARSGETVVKRFRAEEDVIVRIVIDASASMLAGSRGKVPFAQRVAAAVAYLALARGQRTQILVSGGSIGPGARAATSVHRGRGELALVLRAIASLNGGGQTVLSESLERILLAASPPGWFVIISDFLDTRPVPDVLTRARARRHDLSLCHIFDPDDLNLDGMGDLELVDSETGETLEVTVTPELLASVTRNTSLRGAHLGAWARQHRAGYVVAASDASLRHVLERLSRRTVDRA